ncbi:unnamed protein product [Adineta ricciae]|uniref:DYW domain-containing protein n=1 Tax=Adineta ricciae TaxID=249248 RepID=A0A813XY61_ADIRI|nr:unnamed protein product [Adineta ricciae]
MARNFDLQLIMYTGIQIHILDLPIVHYSEYNTGNAMLNKVVCVNFNFNTLFILRQQISCLSSTSTFSSQPRTIGLGQQMRILNEKKQFEQTIELFETEMKKNKKHLSSLIIDQALKACTQVRDFRRGHGIHQLVQHRLSTDSSLVRSLIHFYMQCHDVQSAESLFNVSTNKTVYICGAMMKGYIDNEKPEKAVELFEQIKHPDAVLITLFFKACAQVPSEQSLSLAKNIWKKYQGTSLLNPYALTSLINVLMKHGDLESAETVFNQQSSKGPSMYGAMMKGFIQNEMSQRAIDLFEQVKNPNEILVTLLFNACAQLPSEQSLNLVKNTWEQPQIKSLRNDNVITSLIDALMKCGDIKGAEIVFDESPNHSVYIYAAMMNGYIRNQMSEKAIDLFKQVNEPDDVIITLLFKACAQLPSEQSLNLVKNTWKQYRTKLLHSKNTLTSLIDALMKYGDVNSSEVIFSESREKSISMYATMMKGYIENQLSGKAIDLFKQIKGPNEVIITLLFNACAQLPSEESLSLVKSVWKKYQNTSLLNDHALTALIDALMRCGDVKNAEAIVDKSSHKVLPMYGAMMKGYIKNEIPEKAIDLFQQVKNPNEILVTLLFNACAQLPSEQSLNLIKSTWERPQIKSLRSDNVLASLIDALMKCGDIKSAELVFDESSSKSIYIQGAIMSGYIRNQMPEKAIDLFEQIKNPNEVIITLLFNACAQLPSEGSLSLIKSVWKKYQNTPLLDDQALTALIHALMRCGDVNQAEAIFDQSPHKVLHMYGAMMKGYIHFGYLLNRTPNKTLRLYHQIKNMKITQSNFIIYLLAINASSQIAMASECQSIVDEIPQHILLNTQISNSLIDMWGKAGCVQEAEKVFANLSSVDQVAYASMVHAYGINGMGTKAVELFHQVPQSLVVEATHVCVLNACSHAGLVDQARSIFTSIEDKTEKHYAAMIDCLSRGSLFDEAQRLIDRYELNHPPSPVMYTTILLANLYGSSGDVDKASSIRYELSRSGAKKKPGLSWTAVNGQLFQFHAHDRSHPRSAEIYVELDRISRELIEHGHEYDSSWITRPLAEDETIESVLCGHSEKLAIAWNFVANPNTTFIQITKNLRVCGDCHRATKLIAAIRRCQIVVRDANRIHHFHPNGHCSCNDYF